MDPKGLDNHAQLQDALDTCFGSSMIVGPHTAHPRNQPQRSSDKSAEHLSRIAGEVGKERSGGALRRQGHIKKWSMCPCPTR